MFGRKKDLEKQKEKPKKQKDPERSEKVRGALSDLGGAGAGLCAGMVIDAGLSMIPCPAVKPAAKAAFKVGKWVLSGIGGKLVSNLASTEIKEAMDGAAEAIGELKASRDIPSLEESSEKVDEIEQTYEVDDQ